MSIKEEKQNGWSCFMYLFVFYVSVSPFSTRHILDCNFVHCPLFGSSPVTWGGQEMVPRILRFYLIFKISPEKKTHYSTVIYIFSFIVHLVTMFSILYFQNMTLRLTYTLQKYLKTSNEWRHLYETENHSLYFTCSLRVTVRDCISHLSTIASKGIPCLISQTESKDILIWEKSVQEG